MQDFPQTRRTWCRIFHKHVVPDAGFPTNTSWALNLIFTFLLLLNILSTTYQVGCFVLTSNGLQPSDCICLSPLKLGFRNQIMARCTRYKWLAAGRWFTSETSVSSSNKTDRHNIAVILLKVALSTLTMTLVDEQDFYCLLRYVVKLKILLLREIITNIWW